MKPIQNNKEVIFVDDLIQEAKHEVLQKHDHYLQTTIPLDAEIFAQKNFPAPNETDLSPCISTITGDYIALKKSVAIRIQGELQKFLSKVELPGMNEAIAKAKDTIQGYINKNSQLEIEKKRLMSHCKPNMDKTHVWLLAIFSLAESVLNINCFTRFGDITLISIFCGLAIGVAQVYTVKHVVLYIRDEAPQAKKKKYFKLSLLAFSIISLVLGGIRYVIAHQGAGSGISFIFLNPVTLAIFNLMLLIASALLVYYYFPTKSENQQRKKIEAIKAEINDVLSKKAEEERKYDNLVQKRALAFQMNGTLAHAEKQLLALVDALFTSAVSAWISTNISKRTDGAFPPCFRSKPACLPYTPTEDPMNFTISN